MLKIHPSLGLLPSLFLTDVAAQSIASNVERMTVLGSRIPLEAAESSNNKYVIPNSYISLRNPSSFVDVLRSVPGVNASQQGGAGGIPFISLRGGDENFALVLIDGVKMNDPTATSGGGFDYALIDTQVIERVEIIKGPLSPVYGSGALSGAINIVTRTRDEERSLSGRTSVGTFGDYSISTSATVPTSNSMTLDLFAGWHDSGSEVEGESLRRASTSARLKFKPTSGTKVSGALFLSDIEASSFPQASGGPDFAVLRESESRHGRVYISNLTFEVPFGKSTAIVGDASWSRNQSEINNPGIAPGLLNGIPPLVTDSTFDRLEATGHVSHSVYPGTLYETLDVDFILGGSILKEDGQSIGEIDFGFPVTANFALDRQTESLFAEARFSDSSIGYITASVRYDMPEEFGAKSSVKLSAELRTPITGVSLSADWGQGFKLPSFFAISSPLVGNPNLEPETSTNFSIGIHYESSNNALLATATYFRNSYDNLIDFDPELFTNFNRKSLKVSGVELFVQQALTKTIFLSASTTHLSFEFPNPNEPSLRLRPKWSGSSTLRWSPNIEIAAALTANFVGKRFETIIPTGVTELKSFQTIDFDLLWKPDENYTVVVNVTNLFDRKYYEAAGFPAPGLGARISLAKEF